jgi:hypothetical protein
MLFGAVFLRTGILGHIDSGSPEILPPNNYFIALGSLFAGMAVVMLVIHLKTRDPKQAKRSWLARDKDWD